MSQPFSSCPRPPTARATSSALNQPIGTPRRHHRRPAAPNRWCVEELADSGEDLYTSDDDLIGSQQTMHSPTSAEDPSDNFTGSQTVATAKIGAAEHQLVVERWNGTAQPYPAATSAHKLFEAQSLAARDHTALVFEGATLSYGELVACTSRLVRQLHKAGARSNEVVGLCVEKSMEEVAGMVGIMRAGAAYVPLDPKLPSERLQYLVQSCNCRCGVAEQRLVGLVSSLEILALTFTAGDPAHLAQRTTADLRHTADDPASLAYVLFTSGSTGRPKGVAILQSSLVTFAWAEMCAVSLCASDCILHACSFTFDPSVYLVFSPLFCGAQIVIGKRTAYTDPQYLNGLFIRHCVAFTELVPSVVSTYLAAVPTSAFSSSFRRVYISGESCSRELALRMLTEYPTVQTWNTYGPTEVICV